ncbi:hypothetical protein, partial [Streptomyces plicatus]|uniref:hypothetical protein n=1 Tax=Streptomyces plicatus TaxID=1922 RepID=UPI001C705F45
IRGLFFLTPLLWRLVGILWHLLANGKREFNIRRVLMSLFAMMMALPLLTSTGLLPRRTRPTVGLLTG